MNEVSYHQLPDQVEVNDWLDLHPYVAWSNSSQGAEVQQGVLGR